MSRTKDYYWEEICAMQDESGAEEQAASDYCASVEAARFDHEQGYREEMEKLAGGYYDDVPA